MHFFVIPKLGWRIVNQSVDLRFGVWEVILVFITIVWTTPSSQTCQVVYGFGREFVKGYIGHGVHCIMKVDSGFDISADLSVPNVDGI